MSQNRSIDAQQFAAIIPSLFDCKGLGQRDKPLVEANILPRWPNRQAQQRGQNAQALFYPKRNEVFCKTPMKGKTGSIKMDCR